jgi:hypothetical protein
MTSSIARVRIGFLKYAVAATALVIGGIATQAQSAPPARASIVYFNGNFQDVPLALFPGVTVASLQLPRGEYVMHVKLRYRGQAVGGESPAGCAFQGTGIGGLDFSSARVQLIGEPGTVDGAMMDFVIKNAGDDPDVHVQCFGDPNVHIINSQFSAVASDITFQP